MRSFAMGVIVGAAALFWLAASEAGDRSGGALIAEASRDAAVRALPADFDYSAPKRSYAAVVADTVNRNRYYPRCAQEMGVEGVVAIRFTVSASGDILDSDVASTSGIPGLDKAALNILDRVGELPPMPDGIDEEELSFVLPVVYALR